MRFSLKDYIIPGIPLAIALIGFCFLLWGVGFISYSAPANENINTPLSDNIQLLFLGSNLLSNIFCGLFTLVNAFLISQINNRFTIIRTRTFLPIFIFTLLISSWSLIHTTITPHLALTFFIVALFQFFAVTRQKSDSEKVFLGCFFTGLASILINSYIFLIPFIWIGLIFFQSLTLRTFLASLFGLAAPWLLYFSAGLLMGRQPEFNYRFFTPFVSGININQYTLSQLIYAGCLIIILLTNLTGMYSMSNGDSIRTRKNLNFILMMLIGTSLIALFIDKQFNHFMPLIALFYSLMVSHPFTLKTGKFFYIVFHVFLSANILYIVARYFQI